MPRCGDRGHDTSGPTGSSALAGQLLVTDPEAWSTPDGSVPEHRALARPGTVNREPLVQAVVDALVAAVDRTVARGLSFAAEPPDSPGSTSSRSVAHPVDQHACARAPPLGLLVSTQDGQAPGGLRPAEGSLARMCRHPGPGHTSSRPAAHGPQAQGLLLAGDVALDVGPLHGLYVGPATAGRPVRGGEPSLEVHAGEGQQLARRGAMTRPSGRWTGSASSAPGGPARCRGPGRGRPRPLWSSACCGSVNVARQPERAGWSRRRRTRSKCAAWRPPACGRHGVARVAEAEGSSVVMDLPSPASVAT
jgi:hypothetical protein